MSKLTTIVCDFAKDRSGSSAIEYGLLFSGSSVTVAGAMSAVGDGFQDVFNRIDFVLCSQLHIQVEVFCM